MRKFSNLRIGNKNATLKNNSVKCVFAFAKGSGTISFLFGIWKWERQKKTEMRNLMLDATEFSILAVIPTGRLRKMCTFFEKKKYILPFASDFLECVPIRFLTKTLPFFLFSFVHTKSKWKFNRTVTKKCENPLLCVIFEIDPTLGR